MGVSVACFTANALLLKYLHAARSVDPATALLFRAGMGTVIVVLFFRGTQAIPIQRIFLDSGLVWRGITGIIGTAAFYFTVPSLGPGKATLLCNTYVLFAAVIAAIFLREYLTRRQIFWLGLSFGGITLLAGASQAGAARTLPPGVDEAIALGGALAAASTVVLIRRLTQRFSNGVIFLTQCLWIGLASAPFAIPRLPGLTFHDAAILCLAALGAGFGQLAMNEGYRRLSVTSGASIQMAWPVLTSVGGYIFFAERFTAMQVSGAILILLGIWRITTARRSAG